MMMMMCDDDDDYGDGEDDYIGDYDEKYETIQIYEVEDLVLYHELRKNSFCKGLALVQKQVFYFDINSVVVEISQSAKSCQPCPAVVYILFSLTKEYF